MLRSSHLFLNNSLKSILTASPYAYTFTMAATGEAEIPTTFSSTFAATDAIKNKAPKNALRVTLERGNGSLASSKEYNCINIAPQDKSDVYIKISFKRTVRVTDTAHVNMLPPYLGDFPLYSVRDFASILPADLMQKGGIFFPMYQREAMWIRFSATRPFAIKVYVGGVNAISGLPVLENEATMLKRLKLYRENKSLQDYIVAPEQYWLGELTVSLACCWSFR